MTTKHSSQHVERLARLVERVNGLEGLVEGCYSTPRGSVVKVLSGSPGQVMAVAVTWEREFATCRKWALQPTTLPAHVHEEREVLVVLRGRVVVELQDREVTLEAGGCVQVPPGAAHKILFGEDSIVQATTIPGSMSFPGAPEAPGG